MTLIAGAVGWGGVYLVSDTRVTKESTDGSYSYSDDILKCEITKGGLAIAVSGSVFVNKLLKEDLENRLTNWYKDALIKKKNGYKFTQTPTEVLKEHVEESLRDVFLTDEVFSMSSDDSRVSGLVAIIDNVPMRISTFECKLLKKIISNSVCVNPIINKYKNKIIECSEGIIDSVEIIEFSQGSLVFYESESQSGISPGKLEVNSVNFGEIKAFGSGVSNSHETDSIQTLRYMLCETLPNDYTSIAFHLTRTIGLSDSQVGVDPKFGFKTFGGGVVPSFLLSQGASYSDIGNSALIVLEGDIRWKSDGSLFSEVGHDNQNQTWVITAEGKKETLTKFSEYGSKDKLFAYYKNNGLDLKVKEAKDAEKSGSYFSAAILYKDALILADRAQNSKLIQLCKSKVVEMNKKSQEVGDFKEHQFEYKFSTQQASDLNKFLVSFLKTKDKTKVLKAIGLHPYFMPNIDQIEETSKKTIPLAYQFATLNVVSSEGHNLRGGSLGAYSWLMQMYDLTQKQIMTIYLNRLMHSLIYNNSYGDTMKLKEISDYFSDSRLLRQDRLRIILRGLERYYKKDYVSALHILVPQFESFLVDIVRGLGVSMVALDKKMDIATRTSILSEDNLDSDDFQKIFGRDFCRQIKFVLYEQMGYRLRHKVAHGDMTTDGCNFQNVTMVVYLYLVILARVTVKKSSKSNKNNEQ